MSATVHAAIIEHDADSLRCPELLVAATPAALRVQVATRLAEFIAYGETEHDDLPCMPQSVRGAKSTRPAIMP